jgi:olfactory receptor
MEKHNLTAVSEFILMGITGRPELQAPLFGFFLILYVISVVDNLGMIILTIVDSRLQTPMYFFLRHLAFTDLGYSTAVGPKMLLNFVVDQNTVSYYIVLHSYLSFLCSLVVSVLFYLQCPMTAMWPSVTHCSTQSSCHKDYVGYR